MTKVDDTPKTKMPTKGKGIPAFDDDEYELGEKKIVLYCPYCDKGFSSKVVLDRHVRTHTDDPVTCTKCEATFTQVSTLKKHMREAHGSDMKEGEVFQCDQCDRLFPFKERLRLHYRVHTGERSYQCPQCPKRFSRNGSLQHHIRMHTGARPYSCKLCSASYRSLANLNTHMMRHRGQQDFVCDMCGKRFTRRDGLLKHLACIHYNERAFRCSICNKAFKGHILAHLRTHVMDKPHKCTECGARFIQSSQLVVHMRRHTGMKPYSCPTCNVAFSYTTVLRLHMRLHTGEKPFKCLLCPSSFVQLPHLKKHMRCIHKTDKPYLCLPCYLFFKTKRELDAHLAELQCKPAPEGIAADGTAADGTAADGTAADGTTLLPAAPTALPAVAETSPAEAATAEGAKEENKAASPAEAAIKVDPVTTPSKKGKKRKSDADQMDVSDIVPTKVSQSAADKTPLKNGGPAKRKISPKTVEKMTKPPIGSTPKTGETKSPSPIVLTVEEEEDRVDDPVEVEKESMPIEQMRGLLSTLLTRISAPDRLESFGHGKILVDKVLCSSIESSGRSPIRDPSLSERERLIQNIQILLEWTIPKQYMDCFKRESRSTEDLLEELTS